MNGLRWQKARMRALVCAATVVGLAQGLWAQSAQTQPAAGDATTRVQPREGQIKGDNVYVRSGSHLNYYPVTKLNRGDKVTVVGTQFGWLEILPPAGTFSLIDKTYVDRTGDTGKVNGPAQVYAGSNLDNRRYAKQVKLDKGDSVRVIGETADGAFLKIEPPKGATVWVKADFVDGAGDLVAKTPTTRPVDRVEPGELGLNGETAAATDRTPGATTRPSPGMVVRPPSPGTGRRNPPTPERLRPLPKDDKFQAQISAIEAEIEAESAKPANERNYRPMISKLQPIADQSADDLAQLYARQRVTQLQAYHDAQKDVDRIRSLTEEAIRSANEIAKRREGIHTRPAGPMDQIVLRGEIRVSNIYEGTGGRSKRWRVVEPNSGVAARTLAYIEIPPGSAVNPVDYYGRYVGIRASRQRILNDTIPPVAIYTVEEIIVLDPESRGGRVTGSDAFASPESRRVSPPESDTPSTAPADDEAASDPDDEGGQ